MRKKKYLHIYEKFIGSYTMFFLCHHFDDHDDLFNLMKPTILELQRLFPKHNCCWENTNRAWGSYTDDGTILSGFNPFRQNIVLFMAAMNGEL